MTFRVSPLALTLDYTDEVDATVNLTGASATAQAGSVTVSVPPPGAFAELGPLVLAGPIRTVTAVTGNVTINLGGAQAEAQGEEMEGTNTTITLSGAGVEGLAGGVVAGSVVVSVEELGDRASILFIHAQARDVVLTASQRTTGLTGSDRSLIIIGEQGGTTIT